jgi:hypothetical protein
MMQKFYAVLTILALVVLGGAGCEQVTACRYETEWNSCVDTDGVDEALLGSWTLKGQTVSTANGDITNPFKGRTLTFIKDSIVMTDELGNDTVIKHGTYMEDWSSESASDKSMSGVTSGCDVLGTAGGNWNATYELDPATVNNAQASVVYKLQITPDGGTPKVTCQATGVAINSNLASTPLGVGPTSSNATTTFVEYSYSVNPEWNLLTVQQDNQYSGAKNTFVFTR